MSPITQRALDATARYQAFLDRLRRQFEIAVADDPTHGSVRLEAAAIAKEQAQDWLADEAEVIRIDTYGLGLDAYSAAARATGQASPEAPTELHAHFGNTGNYLLEILAAQAARDISTMVREVNATGMRVDMAQRAGKRKDAALAAAVMDRGQGPEFRFVDRLGRRYSSSKHVRDQYRHHLLTTTNEAFLYAMSEAGVDEVQINHPERNHKWHGEIVGTHDDKATGTSYYDIRDEVFHPSSDAFLSIVE
jgi:hypothetical protein